MDDGVGVHDIIDRLLPERLRRLQRAGGAPVVFGGATRAVDGASSLIISRLSGTVGTSLRGLAVQSGRGLGGTVLRHATPQRVLDYASTATITHHYDHVVVREEQLTSVYAVPLIVRGAVRGVIYGAVRGTQSLGDRALAAATTVAAQLQRDVESLVRFDEPRPPEAEPAAKALDDLAAIAAHTEDPELRARLHRIHRTLGGAALPAERDLLAPREIDTLRLVARGASNLEIASELGLSSETVKAYLRSAMRKLGVHNRTAAVYAATKWRAL
ncbi:response regulator transcription factor [Cryptosporangium sp. NPDC051539]|uniref:response regulator transcription factor n=1 Tax=Cryptosporangium sp. NPDC051539 TaxID=3363962 RepID=UPI0037A98586